MITLMQKTILENTLNAVDAHLYILQQKLESEETPNHKLLSELDSKRKQADKLKKQLARISKQYGNESFNALNSMKKNPLKENRDLFG